MPTEKAVSTDFVWNFSQKIIDYVQLGKLRLSLVVVFSAGVSYLIGLQTAIDWWIFSGLLVGGLMITLSANAINEILERKYDALMQRTAMRPLPAGRMEIREAITFAFITGMWGLSILYFLVSLEAAFLGAASLILYSFIYTPLKRITSFSVFIGAIPGALPTLIGWLAATSELEAGGWVLFTIQFLWQLPHFWSIAWLGFEEYTRAGYRLMPLGGGKDRKSAWQILIYTMFLLPISFLPYYFQMTSWVAVVILLLLAILFSFPCILLIRRLSRRQALWIMFASFLYLPLAQLAILLDKV
ncbi:MAG: heme o synthase [Bacteroidia bacterium]|nr:heme o synthase [Bacteroidia bacterium]MDW8157862.1 heme o synthase [Bacteroidia bacterium]